MTVEHIKAAAGERSQLTHQQRAAIAVAAALETALTSTCPAGGGRALTFTFTGESQLQAACDAWRAYAIATIDTPAPLAATATQRLTAQIGLALFDDPTLDLAQVANIVTRARSDSLTALLPAPTTDVTEAPDGRS